MSLPGGILEEFWGILRGCLWYFGGLLGYFGVFWGCLGYFEGVLGYFGEVLGYFEGGLGYVEEVLGVFWRNFGGSRWILVALTARDPSPGQGGGQQRQESNVLRVLRAQSHWNPQGLGGPGNFRGVPGHFWGVLINFGGVSIDFVEFLRQFLAFFGNFFGFSQIPLFLP